MDLSQVVKLWLFSEPKLLGTFIADEVGSTSSLLSIPNVTDGYHTLQIQGVNENGEDLTANLGVEVFTKTVIGTEIKATLKGPEFFELDINMVQLYSNLRKSDIYYVEKTQQATTNISDCYSFLFV